MCGRTHSLVNVRTCRRTCAPHRGLVFLQNPRSFVLTDDWARAKERGPERARNLDASRYQQGAGAESWWQQALTQSPLFVTQFRDRVKFCLQFERKQKLKKRERGALTGSSGSRRADCKGQRRREHSFPSLSSFPIH